MQKRKLGTSGLEVSAIDRLHGPDLWILSFSGNVRSSQPYLGGIRSRGHLLRHVGGQAHPSRQ